MLVLASVYKSKLYPLLTCSNPSFKESTLLALFTRTFAILEEESPHSQILDADIQILRVVQAWALA